MAGADLRIVNCQITVRQILDLFKRFSLTANFKEVSIINQKITLFGVDDFMTCGTQLV